MLKIRQEQVDELVGDSLVDDVIEAMQEDFPQYVDGIPGPELRQRIVVNAEAARRFGFTAFDDILAFVYLGFEIGPRFHLQQRINEVLTNPAIPLNRRFDALDRLTTESDWREAAAI